MEHFHYMVSDIVTKQAVADYIDKVISDDDSVSRGRRLAHAALPRGMQASGRSSRTRRYLMQAASDSTRPGDADVTIPSGTGAGGGNSLGAPLPKELGAARDHFKETMPPPLPKGKAKPPPPHKGKAKPPPPPPEILEESEGDILDGLVDDSTDENPNQTKWTYFRESSDSRLHSRVVQELWFNACMTRA